MQKINKVAVDPGREDQEEQNQDQGTHVAQVQETSDKLFNNLPTDLVEQTALNQSMREQVEVTEVPKESKSPKKKKLRGKTEESNFLDKIAQVAGKIPLKNKNLIPDKGESASPDRLEPLNIADKLQKGAGGMFNAMSSAIFDREILTMKESNLQQIQNAHRLNQLEDNQFDSAKSYMKNVMYSVPLSKLYKVRHSCQYNQSGDFCPVIVEIMDEEIKAKNDGYKYLLQVWSKTGDLIFEKSLRQPVCNWNISANIFIFQQNVDSSSIYVVRLYEFQQAILFKFVLPDNLIKNRTNTAFSKQESRFVVPKEESQQNQNQDERAQNITMSDMDSQEIIPQKENGAKKQDYDWMVDDVAEMEALGEFCNKTGDGKAQKLLKHSSVDWVKESVTQILGDKIIERAPDKMVDFLQGHILLAYRNSIIYLNVSEFGIDEEELKISDKILRGQDQNYIEVQVTHDKIDELKLRPNYKIICLQDIGDKMVAIVLEDLNTRQIRFLRAKYDNDGKKYCLKLVQLGILVNQTKMQPSKLLKYRSVMKIDAQTNKKYQVGIVLRENGRFEVYSDYMLVNEYMNPELQVVDIETDFHEFHLKFVTNVGEVNRGKINQVKDLKYEVRTVAHFWRNRISFNTSKQVSSEKFGYVIHRRISNYFNMYSTVLNFGIYMCVAHRNMISVFDMTSIGQDNDGEWIDTVELSEGVIRKMFIKKRSKEERQRIIDHYLEQGLTATGKNQNLLSIYKKYQLVTIVGTNSIYYTTLSSSGKILMTKNKLSSPGRILKFQDDPEYNCGLLLLIDESVFSKSFENVRGCNFYTFPLVSNKYVHVRLYGLKMGKFHKLLEDKESNCVTYDCVFSVIRANRAVFERDKDEFGEEDITKEDDVVKKAFEEKDYCNIVLVTSPSGSCSVMYPFTKEKENGLIDAMKLVTDKDYIKEIEYEQDQDDSAPFHSFYVRSEEFGDAQDSFVQVSAKKIRIYDSDMQLKFVYEGLNIRASQDIHQSYFYSISDNIEQPYTLTSEQEDDKENTQTEANWKFRASGFYVYDMYRLLQGKVERYKLASAIGGASNLIDNSKFSDRFSFIQNFDNICVIPFPHLNTINFVGMGQKNEYLIWRESNGFFTALDRKSNLLTWSLTSGKLIYSETQKQDASADQIYDYEVYQTDENDITYTRNFYNLENRSINLLKSQSPLSNDLAEKQQKLKKSDVELKLIKQQKKNYAGLVNLDPNVEQLEKDLFQSNQQDMDIKILNSQQKAELYHFKVMELRTHEDTKSNSICRMRFHFIFDLIKKKEKQHLSNFDWDVNTAPLQRLYLSRDTSRLMVVINNFIATVYSRSDVSISDGSEYLDQDSDNEMHSHAQYDRGQQVKWKVEYRIKRFPTSLVQHTSVPYLFSPNFTYQLDFNYRAKQFIIKVTKTQHIYMYIPNDLISTVWNKNQSEQAIKIICSRICWEDERVLRIVNESNLDCIFEMRFRGENDQDINARYLKLLSVVKIDNQHENMVRLDSPHFLKERTYLEPRDVLERLIRTNQDYKTSLYHAINRGNEKYKILQKINKIDYLQPWKLQTSSFDCELSFTWLDWRISDLLTSSDRFDLENIDKEQTVQLCFNIQPYGHGILHKLALGDKEQASTLENNPNSKSGDQISAFLATGDLFDLTSEKQQLWITGADEGTNFEIPILPDVYGANPLDICLGINTKRKNNHQIFRQCDDSLKSIEDSENLAMANIIFEGIADYGFMHSSYQITEALIVATKLALPSVGDYLESRFKKVNHFFSSKTQRDIQKSSLKNTPSMGPYGAMRSPIWAPESQIKKKLFQTEGALQPMNLQFLDIPGVYNKSSIGFDFIYALNDCKDINIFALKSVQIIIDQHASYWDVMNYVCLGFPMTLQLVIFWYWSNIVIINVPGPKDNNDNSSFKTQNQVCRQLLVLTAIYLIVIELSVLYKQKLSYFNSIESILNFITPILIMNNVVTVTEKIEYTEFWTVQTWAALAIWFRFLLYLRTISVFSYLIRMILACIKDMMTFLFVLIIGVMAFADAFKSIEKALVIEEKMTARQFSSDDTSSWYDQYLQSYVKYWQISFLTALGEFDDSLGSYRDQDWLVFVMCAIFNIILLLNLLIAIISETYQQISDTRVETSYKEKVAQISIMQDSIFGYRKQSIQANELIFIAKVINSKEIEEAEVSSKIDLLDGKLDEIKTQIIERNDDKIQLVAVAIINRIDQTASGVAQDKGQGINALQLFSQKSTQREKSGKYSKPNQFSQKQVNSNKRKGLAISVGKEVLDSHKIRKNKQTRDSIKASATPRNFGAQISRQ